MRVSALRITKPQPAPPPPAWEEYEDLHDISLRHGRLWHDTADVIRPRNYPSDYPYGLSDAEAWREQQNAKNKALALAQYEWHKPENVEARAIKARAEYAAQQARQAARDNAIREQLVFSEAIRILREDEETEAERKWIAEQKAANAKRIEAEIDAATEWWGEFNPAFRDEKYHPCKFDRLMNYHGVDIWPGKGYWLPATVRLAFLRQLGLRT